MNKQIFDKIEPKIVFCLCLFYLGINLPSPIPSILSLLSFLIIPLLIIRQWRKFIYFLTQDLLLVVLVGTAAASLLWSTNFGETLAHNRPLLSSSAFGIYLATQYSPKELMKLMVWVFGTYVLLNLLVPIIFPAFGTTASSDGFSWQGVAGHKNNLAASMVMSATLFLDLGIYGYKCRRIFWIAAGIASIILLLSQGKASLAIFVGLSFLLPLYGIVTRQYKLRTLIFLLVFPLGLALVVTILLNIEFIVIDFLGKDMEFTGRIPLWNYLIQRGLEKPWLGYGYGAFWTNPAETLRIALNTPWMTSIANGAKGHAHNAYIDLFLQLGGVGLLLTALSLLAVSIRVILLLCLTRQIEYFWMLQLLLFMTIGNLSDSATAFLSYRSLYWVLYVSTACTSAIHFKRILNTGNKLVNLQYENTAYQHQRF